VAGANGDQPLAHEARATAALHSIWHTQAHPVASIQVRSRVACRHRKLYRGLPLGAKTRSRSRERRTDQNPPLIEGYSGPRQRSIVT
jgi:hypothetical protein